MNFGKKAGRFQRGCGCVKSISPPSAAEFYIETALDSLILLRKINESSAVSNDYSAIIAKLYLDVGVFSLILRSKIRVKKPKYKAKLAPAGGVIIHTQPKMESKRD
ncbi:MAG: hypothetical protein RL386_1433, partial [Bacteroidota bacterium]